MGDLLFYGLAGALPVTSDLTTSTPDGGITDSLAGLLPLPFGRFLQAVFFGAPPTTDVIRTESHKQEEPEGGGAEVLVHPESTFEPDYERAKFHYTQAYTMSKKSSHVQSKARFALGWMYERGFPGAGMPRDIHLAKRMYDDAGSLSRDAKTPVQLALLRMRVTEALYTIREFVRGWFGMARTTDSKMGPKSDPQADSQLEEKKKPPKKTFPKTKDAKGASIREGSMVRARWKGGSHYFTGYVDNVNLDGTVSVQYDDGDFEIGVRAPFIERVAKRLHPIWVAKQKDSGIESESAGGLASGSKNSERLNKKKREGIISGSWPIRTLRSVNWDVCAVVAMFFFFMIFAVWLALRLVPRPKRVISVACGMVLARAVYVLAIEGF